MNVVTPGVPFVFQIPSVSTPTLFRCCAVVVPENATRLQVRADLPPGAQFALGLKYGSDFQGGRFNPDHGGTVGENTVEVTRLSSPPLRGGNYFIGVAVLTSTSGSGRFTATIGTGAPAISVGPPLVFGFVNAGQSQQMTLAVRNTGNEPLTVNSISSSNAQFAATSPSTPFSVPASGEQGVVVRFQPTAGGAQSGTLTIASNDPFRPSVTVAVSGQGVAPPLIGLSTTSLTFSAQAGTNPPPQTFTVRNSGSGTLNYSVSASQPWLSVSPTTGSSTGSANTLTAAVNTSGLSGGTLLGEIRVSQVAAASSLPEDFKQASPSVIAVRLTLTEVATVSAASFVSGAAVAAESIVSAFGQGLAAASEGAAAVPLPTSLGGASVRVKDSAGVERLAPLFYASPGQVNYLVPEGTRPGPAALTVTVRDQVAGTGRLQVDTVAPGVFTANASGRGVPAALSLRVRGDIQTVQPVFQCGAAAGSCVPTPIDLGPENDQVFLLLFGTGIRGFSRPAAVTATIGGEAAEVLGVAPQGQFVGLDQINLRLSRRLLGRGEVNVVLSVDGKPANSVTIRISGTPELQALSCSEETTLRPGTSNTPSSIQFINASGEVVKVFWLNATGQRVLYQTLPVNSSYTQSTFVTHPWVVTDSGDRCLAIYVSPAGESIARIVRGN